MSTVPVRLDPDVHAELTRIKQEFRAEHRGDISLSAIVRGLLEDRKAQRAMDAAAREADRKPVGS